MLGALNVKAATERKKGADTQGQVGSGKKEQHFLSEVNRRVTATAGSRLGRWSLEIRNHFSSLFTARGLLGGTER